MTADLRALAVVCAVILAAGAGAGVAGIADHLAVAALIAVGVAWWAVGRVRQELRIRRRVADTAGTRPADWWAATGTDREVPCGSESPSSSTSLSSSPQHIPRQAGPVAGVTERTGGAA